MTSIPLEDPRLVAIGAGSLDDPGPSIGAELPSRTGLSLRRDGDMALFQMGKLSDGTPVEVVVRIDGGAAVFFPQRSSAHRQLLAALGIEE